MDIYDKKGAKRCQGKVSDIIRHLKNKSILSIEMAHFLIGILIASVILFTQRLNCFLAR